MMEPNELFFYQLLIKAKSTYHKCSLADRYPGEKWGYAVCDTPIRKNVPILFGLNWGGDKELEQTKYPELHKERDWKFAAVADKFIKDYLLLDGITDFNYSNLCFIRSPKINKLTFQDWQLTAPLCKEYIEYIQPPYILIFGGAAAKELVFHHETNFRSKWIYKDGGRARIFIGQVLDGIPTIGLPHSNSRLSSALKNECYKEGARLIQELSES